jgi:peptidoglycan hydrolase-like protein with peptidoglycan-binding domain
MLRRNIRSSAGILAAVFLVSISLSGCGTAPPDRAASGGGIGMAAGAVIGVLTGGLSVLAGALIGGTAGAVTGAVTTKDEIDLGEPIWKRWLRPAETAERPAGPANHNVARLGDTDAQIRPMVQGIQQGLTRLGYDPGGADGRTGPKTRLAIARYQKDHKLLIDRRATPELLRHIETQTGTG